MTLKNKLIRDLIPNIIQNQGINPITRISDKSEYKVELDKKIQDNFQLIFY